MQAVTAGSGLVVRRGDSCLPMGVPGSGHSISPERALHSISFPLKDRVLDVSAGWGSWRMEDGFRKIKMFIR